MRVFNGILPTEGEVYIKRVQTNEKIILGAYIYFSQVSLFAKHSYY